MVFTCIKVLFLSLTPSYLECFSTWFCHWKRIKSPVFFFPQNPLHRGVHSYSGQGLAHKKHPWACSPLLTSWQTLLIDHRVTVWEEACLSYISCVGKGIENSHFIHSANIWVPPGNQALFPSEIIPQWIKPINIPAFVAGARLSGVEKQLT